MTRHLALVLALAASPAIADTPKKPDPTARKPDAAAVKKASNHFKLGQEFFKSGQWDRAITEYQAALDLTGEPLMIFNIALAHDRAGRPEEALAGYLKYLDTGPDGAIADEARGYVAKLTLAVEKLKKQRAADAIKRAENDKRAQEDARRKADEAKQAEAARIAAVARTERANGVERTSKLERYAGIGVAVVGAAVFGYGIKRGLDAQSIDEELSTHEGPWTDAQLARDADGKAADKQMKIFTVVGGAIVLGGAALYTIGYRTHRRAERMRIGAAPLPGGAAASFSVRF